MDVFVDANARPAVYASTTQEILALIALTAAPAMHSMSMGALQMGLTQIGDSFGATGSSVTWLLAAYTLTSGSFLLLFGKIADLIGRKKVLVCAFIWFAMCSLIAGFIRNYIAFCILRGLQGLAGAACTTASVGILGHTYDNSKRKNRAFACYGGGQPTGYIIGIIAGGICINFIGWQAILFFLAILYTLITVIAILCVPEDPILQSSKRTQLRKLDYLGAFLITTGFGLLIFGITQAESVKGAWKNPVVYGTIIAGVVGVATFVVWEKFVKDPLMPLSVWKYRQFGLIMAIIMLAQMAFPVTLQFYTTLWFQKVRKTSPLLLTAYFSPQAIFGIAVNVFTAFTLHKIPGTVFLVVGMFAFLSGSLLWALQPINITYWAMAFPAMILSVVGADLVYMVVNLFVVESVGKADQSMVGGVLNTCIQIGSSLGLAFTAAISMSVETQQPGYDKLKGTDEEWKVIVPAYRAVFWFSVGATALGVVLACFAKVGRQGAEPKGHGLEGGCVSPSNSESSTQAGVSLSELSVHTSGENDVVNIRVNSGSKTDMEEKKAGEA